jgi:anhydro-N-acetylmuramic acid kinase
MKNKLHSNVIGLMSGTSADGIDISIVNTDGVDLSSNNQNLIFPYSENIKKKLRFIMNNPEYIWKKKSLINTLDLSVTKEHIDAVNFVKRKYGIKPSLIGFHGQTIFHDMKKKISIQLGNGRLLSEKTNCKVVFDFRSQDIQNGGEGAPLAPIYHQYILNKLFGKTAACMINIGGVSNLSYVSNELVSGFDTGPGCGLMDEYMQKNFNKHFDEHGTIASFGIPNQKIIKKIMNDSFFKKPPPKSIDKFQFKHIFEDKEFLKLNVFDGMATLCNLTADTISVALQELNPLPKAVLISGGGRHNNLLLTLIKNKTNSNIFKIDDYNFDGDFVESELIAYLAARCLNNLPSTYPFTTGTKFPTICGRLVN